MHDGLCLSVTKVKVLSGHQRAGLGAHNDALISMWKPKQTKEAAANRLTYSLRSYVRWTLMHSLPVCQSSCVQE